MADISELAAKTHVFLVEPEDNANIGAAARAMKNLGFVHLHLVAPRRYEYERASLTACFAADLLNNVELHSDLDSALAGFEDVIGFSARLTKNRPGLLLPEWLTERQRGGLLKTALLFGAEDNGLNDRQAAYCRHMIKIPAAEPHTSFNLSQAVLLVLYEICRTSLPATTGRQEQRALWGDFEQLERLLKSVLQLSGFKHRGTPPRLEGLITNLFRRTQPTEREIRILLGIFSSIEKKLGREDL